MKSKCVLIVIGAVLLLTFSVSIIAGEQNKPDVIKLSKPELKSGKLLMQALKDRKSS